jgi:predicted Zn finger-like uncharacterized protein
MTRKLTPETQLKRTINKFLKSVGVFTFHVLQGLGAYKGVSDRIGLHEKKVKCPHCKKKFMCQGHMLAIEVKSPKGKLSEYQKVFLEEIEKRGGIAIVAWNLDDLIDGLNIRDRFLF